MSEQSGGFSADWLALREPVDHASVNHGLRMRLIEHLRGRDHLRICDLGCGTGSNYRGLAPDLSPARQSWTLCDIDPALLDVAAGTEPHDGTEVTTRQIDLNLADLAELAASADLVTASALFDVTSREVVSRVAEACAKTRAAFYTVLTYDGLAAWFPEHELNGAMRSAFNAHQETDKGMGTALGPSATDALADAFAAVGYEVVRAPSPWVIKSEHQALQRALDIGWADAAVASSFVSRADADVWVATRHADDAVTLVGHEDLIALPPSP
ncbi:MAG: class I SAM-dependent methyltransferase [Pseudomonadota bacterium]